MNLPRVFNGDQAVMPGTLSGLLDNFFDDVVKRGELTRFSPSVDISESDNSYEMKLEVPGMKKDDFRIEVHDNTLQVSGERKWEKEDKNRTYHRVECQYGSFTRSFRVPEDANADKIDATYKDGVLRITIEKDPARSNTRKISIK